MPNAFVDTNVLVYAADESASDPRKTRIARELLRQPDLHLSVQVLNEFTVNARNRAKLDLTKTQEQEWLKHWLLFPVHAITVDTFVAAQLIHYRFQLSQWDSLILASAGEAECKVIYTEDLNTDQDYGGIKAINPFV